MMVAGYDLKSIGHIEDDSYKVRGVPYILTTTGNGGDEEYRVLLLVHDRFDHDAPPYTVHVAFAASLPEAVDKMHCYRMDY